MCRNSHSNEWLGRRMRQRRSETERRWSETGDGVGDDRLAGEIEFSLGGLGNGGRRVVVGGPPQERRVTVFSL